MAGKNEEGASHVITWYAKWSSIRALKLPPIKKAAAKQIIPKAKRSPETRKTIFQIFFIICHTPFKPSCRRLFF